MNTINDDQNTPAAIKLILNFLVYLNIRINIIRETIEIKNSMCNKINIISITFSLN